MKRILVVVVSVIIFGCSNKPDKSQAISQVEKELTSDRWVATNVQYVNGFAKDENNYVVSVSFTRLFEKSLDEIYRENQELGKFIRNLYGNVEPGMAFDETADAKFVKSENGWIMRGWEAGPNLVGRNSAEESKNKEKSNVFLDTLKGKWSVEGDSIRLDKHRVIKPAAGQSENNDEKIDGAIFTDGKLFLINTKTATGPGVSVAWIGLSKTPYKIDLVYISEEPQFSWSNSHFVESKQIVRGLMNYNDSEITLCLSAPGYVRPMDISCAPGNKLKLIKTSSETNSGDDFIGKWQLSNHFIEIDENGKFRSFQLDKNQTETGTYNGKYHKFGNELGFSIETNKVSLITLFNASDRKLKIGNSEFVKVEH